MVLAREASVTARDPLHQATFRMCGSLAAAPASQTRGVRERSADGRLSLHVDFRVDIRLMIGDSSYLT